MIERGRLAGCFVDLEPSDEHEIVRRIGGWCRRVPAVRVLLNAGRASFGDRMGYCRSGATMQGATEAWTLLAAVAPRTARCISERGMGRDGDEAGWLIVEVHSDGAGGPDRIAQNPSSDSGTWSCHCCMRLSM